MKKKTTIIIVSISAVAVLLITISVLSSALKGNIPIERVYDAYLKELESHNEQLIEYYETTKIKNIAIANIYGSDIPELIYITYEENHGQQVPCFHAVSFDGNLNRVPSLDNEILLSSSAEDSETYFYDGDQKFFYRLDGCDTYKQKYGLKYKIWRISNEKDARIYELLDTYKYGSEQIVLISSLPESTVENIIPNVKENKAMNYYQAIDYLINYE